MKQKIEALSNAFNIGFELGAQPYTAGKNNKVKPALKRAIEEGLKILASQPTNQQEQVKCQNCGYNPIAVKLNCDKCNL